MILLLNLYKQGHEKKMVCGDKKGTQRLENTRNLIGVIGCTLDSDFLMKKKK